MTSTTIVYDRANFPRATVVRDALGFTAVIDLIEGLAPDRSVSAEELGVGITSLDPPTVRGDTTRELIDRSMLAVSLAVEATTGPSSSISEILFARYRTAIAVRGALSDMGEDV